MNDCCWKLFSLSDNTGVFLQVACCLYPTFVYVIKACLPCYLTRLKIVELIIKFKQCGGININKEYRGYRAQSKTGSYGYSRAGSS